MLVNFHYLLFLQVFNHVILSPHVPSYFWMCTGHYSYELTCRGHSYVALFPQMLSFSFAGCLRVQTVWLHQSSFSDSAPLKLSIIFLWDCPLPLPCSSVRLQSKVRDFQCLPPHSVPRLQSPSPWPGETTASLLSLSVNSLERADASRRKMVLHMHGLISWAFIFSRWQFFTAFLASCSVLVDIVHIFSCTVCSQQGVWLEWPVLHCWE